MFGIGLYLRLNIVEFTLGATFTYAENRLKETLAANAPQRISGSLSTDGSFDINLFSGEIGAKLYTFWRNYSFPIATWKGIRLAKWQLWKEEKPWEN